MFLKLNNDYLIPQLAVGTWKIQDQDTLSEILDEALKLGITHVDTAKCYENEHLIGNWLINQKREDIFLTSKLWNDNHDDVAKALDKSLEKLKTNYLDLYLIHWPVNFNGVFDLEHVWKQMEKLVEMKKVRSIGVSNFGIKNLTKLLSFCKIKPVVNQIEIHPYFPQYEVREFCKKANIVVEAYSPFGSVGHNNINLLKYETINKRAQEHSKSPHQVILSFLLGEELVVIPKTSSKKHLKQNSELIELKKHEIQAIKDIEIRCKFIDPSSFGKNRFD